jgi:transcriptional regulator with XRE-family HTH domain
MLEVHSNKTAPCENPPRMGRTRKAPSRELIRFSWLISQLEAAGMGQMEIAKATGIKISYLNQIKQYEKYGKTGVGAETVRLAMTGLKIDPSYFFDDYEDEKRVSAIEASLALADRERADQAVEIAKLKAAMIGRDQEVAEMRAELRRALGKVTVTPTPASSRKARSS